MTGKNTLQEFAGRKKEDIYPDINDFFIRKKYYYPGKKKNLTCFYESVG